MNALFVFVAALVAFSDASSSGTVVVGPSGIVTDKGAIGPIGSELGHGLNLGVQHGAVISAPVITHGAASYATPIISHGIAHSYSSLSQGIGAVGLSHGLGAAGLSHGVGAAALTQGGGHISASAHGASIQGPPTAPVVVSGPSGKIQADGLWGPTGNVGQTHHGW